MLNPRFLALLVHLVVSAELSQWPQLVSNSVPTISLLNSSGPFPFPEAGSFPDQVFLLDVSDPDNNSLSVDWSIGDDLAFPCLVQDGKATCTVSWWRLSAPAGTITFTVSNDISESSVSVNFTSGTYESPRITWRNSPGPCTPDSLHETFLSFTVLYDGPGTVRVDYDFWIEDFEMVGRSVLRESVRGGEIVNDTIEQLMSNYSLPSEGWARIDVYAVGIYGGSSSSSYYLGISIPEAPHLTRVAPDTGVLGLFWDNPPSDLIVTLGIASESPVLIEYARSSGSWGTIEGSVTPGPSVPVVIPLSVWQDISWEHGEVVLLIRVYDDIYRSQSISFNCWIYPRGFPVVQDLSSKVNSFYVPGDTGVTLDLSLYDTDSQTLTLRCNSQPSNMSDLISGVAPASPITLTIPTEMLLTQEIDNSLYLTAADGENASAVEGVEIDPPRDRFSLAVDPPMVHAGRLDVSQIPPLSLKIRGVDIGEQVVLHFVISRYRNGEVDASARGNLSTVVVRSSIEIVPIPSSAWTYLPSFPGLWELKILATMRQTTESTSIIAFSSNGSDMNHIFLNSSYSIYTTLSLELHFLSVDSCRPEPT